jgi:hypothetical protein
VLGLAAESASYEDLSLADCLPDLSAYSSRKRIFFQKGKKSIKLFLLKSRHMGHSVRISRKVRATDQY